jgi:hypothetical protein
LLQTAAREQNVRGDHDVERLHHFDDPIIGGVEVAPYDLECYPRFIRNPHPGVGHQGDVEVISLRDSIDLLFDGARVGIDKDVQQ